MRAGAVFVACGLVAAACSGGGSAESAADPPSTSTTVAPSSTSPAAPSTTTSTSTAAAPTTSAPHVTSTAPASTEPPAGTAAPSTAAPAPAFRSSVGPIDGATQDRMTPTSWREGCPVPLADLRLLSLRHWTFDGRVAQGEMVVHADAADAIVAVFRAAYAARYPIERMRLVDDYGGDDDRSMAANNTSAFNCRTVGGTSRWSQHAFGRAVDVNPLYNPYVSSGGSVDPPSGARWANRSEQHPAMIRGGDAVQSAFSGQGWGWGGSWSSVKDYQHFSANGR